VACLLALCTPAFAQAGGISAHDGAFPKRLAAAGVGVVHQLVPAYFAPGGSPDPWQTMCAGMRAGSTAIVNPRNGPVKRQARSYLAAMKYCEERGQKVIGYVYTRYGKRSITKVERAIAEYYRWYPTVQGIFLDEMADEPSARIESYYKTLANAVHERGGIVVGNPGVTPSSAWPLSEVDAVVTFEGSAVEFATYEPAAWVSHAQPEQIANIIFAASDEAQMARVCEKAHAINTGLLYVTNLPEQPNPYEALPAYWSNETASC
jgi:spherulation-specific family 4 protein